jgi:hypothetical protein
MFFMNGKLENEFQTKFFLRLQFEKSTLEYKSKISHLLNQHRETLGDTCILYINFYLSALLHINFNYAKSHTPPCVQFA